MGFFDKLKENVNKAVDVDKLKEMANKTVDSVKREVVKAVDPSVKEQERLEKERIAKEQEEAKRQEKERAVSDFLSSIDLDQELEYIFGVLEKGKASAINFEKGVDHLLSKNDATNLKQDIMPALKKELVDRAFSDPNNVSVPMVILIDYFVREVIGDKLLIQYMSFAVSRERGSSFSFMVEPFVKSLYGIAGRVNSYRNNKLEQGTYSPMNADDFLDIIENSSVLKSYTDKDPFTADEVRGQWAQDIFNAPLEIVKSSQMSSQLEEEEYMDGLYYFAYLTLCEDNPSENVCVEKIANAYLDYLKNKHESIRR